MLKDCPRSFSIQLIFGVLLALPAQAQISQAALSPQKQKAVNFQLRPDQVFTVDATGMGDFINLQTAIDAAPSGGLLVLKAGTYQAATVSAKGLRIESEVQGAASIDGLFQITNTAAGQNVSVGGVSFMQGFEIDSCLGDVSLARCTSMNDGLAAVFPPGLTPSDFFHFPDCGIGGTRHTIQSSTSVTLVDCIFQGRNGESTGCDGIPGEHGLLVENSRVDVYGGALAGGDGADGPGCHGGYAGSGGDAVQARGILSLVRLCDVDLSAGTGGLDLELHFFHGCPGELSRSLDSAVFESCASDNLTFELDSLVRTGDTPFYTITAPPGTDLFLLVAPQRDRRDFFPDEGTYHLGGPFQIIPLGLMPASGVLTRPYPAPRPRRHNGFAKIEIQAYALIGTEQRYSEPRALQTVSPGL